MVAISKKAVQVEMFSILDEGLKIHVWVPKSQASKGDKDEVFVTRWWWNRNWQIIQDRLAEAKESRA